MTLWSLYVMLLHGRMFLAAKMCLTSSFPVPVVGPWSVRRALATVGGFLFGGGLMWLVLWRAGATARVAGARIGVWGLMCLLFLMMSRSW